MRSLPVTWCMRATNSAELVSIEQPATLTLAGGLPSPAAGTAKAAAAATASTAAVDSLLSMLGENSPEGRELRFSVPGACRAAAEALAPPAGVDQLLATGVERVAVRADLDMELGLRGASPELVAAGAAHVGRHVLGMDIGLHRPYESSGA